LLLYDTCVMSSST